MKSKGTCRIKQLEIEETARLALVITLCFVCTAAPAVSPSDMLLHLCTYTEDNKLQKIQMKMLKRI